MGSGRFRVAISEMVIFTVYLVSKLIICAYKGVYRMLMGNTVSYNK